MDPHTIFSEFGRTRKKAIQEYRQFIREAISEGHNPELTGRGLIRSQVGWSQVMAKRRREQNEEHGTRILGSGLFVSSILRMTDEILSFPLLKRR